MKTTILKLFIVLAFLTSTSLACNQNCDYPKKPPTKQIKQIDKILNERLNFTKEQKIIIKENHQKFKKEMDKLISQMQKEHDSIRNVYLIGLPHYQANLRTAPAKARLVILKQQAENLRIENRKNFEKVLTPEQKEEFEKIKIELQKEFSFKKPH